MSDQSDTSSFNGDWETINDSSQETDQELAKLREEVKMMKMEMDKKEEEIVGKNIQIYNEEIEKNARELFEKDLMIEMKDREVKKLRESKEAKDKENEGRRSNIKSGEDEMESLMEEMKRKKMEMDKKDEEIAERNIQISEKNEKLMEKDREIEKKDGEFSTLREMKEAKDMENEQLRSKIELLEKEKEKLREETKIDMKKKDKQIAKKTMEIKEKNDTLSETIMKINKKDVEIKTLREKEETKAKEIEELRSKIETLTTVSLEEWMKVEMESVKSSAKHLNEKITEVYKEIAENELARGQATILSDRNKRTKNIQKMEDLCGHISKDVLENNTKWMAQITSLLHRIQSPSALKFSESTTKILPPFYFPLPIESFLGEFTAEKKEQMSLMQWGTEQLLVRTIIIRKSIVDGYFDLCWKFNNGKEAVSAMWIPDNLQRNLSRFRIEKNVLIRAINQSELCFVLQDQSLTFGQYLYTRNREEIPSVQKSTNKTTSKNLTIDSFLGRFTAGENDPMSFMQSGTEQVRIRSIIIRKANTEGYFESCWKDVNGKESVSDSWIPDNVERNGFRYRIENNVLIRVYQQALLCHALTDCGLIFNGNYSYPRVY